MNELKIDLLKSYKEIIVETYDNHKDIDKEINNLMDKIRFHISNLDPILHEKKKDLMIAIRLVECFRILDWIKVK